MFFFFPLETVFLEQTEKKKRECWMWRSVSIPTPAGGAINSMKALVHKFECASRKFMNLNRFDLNRINQNANKNVNDVILHFQWHYCHLVGIFFTY